MKYNKFYSMYKRREGTFFFPFPCDIVVLRACSSLHVG